MPLALAALALACTLADERTPEARPEDVKSVDAILGALYDTISGPAGSQTDWDRFRSLFVPGARLIPVAVDGEGKSTLWPLDVEAFIKVADANRKKAGFFENEVARKTEAFGHVAQVFSTYEARRAKDEKPYVRGINSFQLYHDGRRWWVVTIFWDAERPGQPIPPEYEPKAK